MSRNSTELLELSAMVVAAFVRHNRLPLAELAGLIEQTHAALGRLGQEPAAPPAEKPVPAVPIRKSVTPDAIYSLEDGKPFKSLKRHLRSAYDMSPDEYRAKWDLPADYPMVAPNYAETRSQMAKSLGLGRKKGQAAPQRREKRG
ncbi:MucR family transcriptional regulator [Bosea vestrisii]|nr:MucR family transcriptional regulator [Bosea vestrisii]WID98539.1 MucR family transcriptional regulator [Bosea vestrisii]